MSEFSDFFKLLVKVLENSKINYVIVGGLISIYYGRPRLTQDIDVIVEATEEELERLATILKKENFEVDERELIENVLNLKSHYTVFHSNFPILHADIKGVYNELDKEVINNKLRMEIFNTQTWIESLEDIIVAKLVYGSQQDYEDAFAVVVAQEEKIDMKVLVRKARKFNVLGKLEQILKEKKKFLSEL
ncbi:MAG: DUF6036 family nucleotidyltransferase [Thermoproteota archaeon]